MAIELKDFIIMFLIVTIGLMIFGNYNNQINFYEQSSWDTMQYNKQNKLYPSQDWRETRLEELLNCKDFYRQDYSKDSFSHGICK